MTLHACRLAMPSAEAAMRSPYLSFLPQQQLLRALSSSSVTSTSSSSTNSLAIQASVDKVYPHKQDLRKCVIKTSAYPETALMEADMLVVCDGYRSP
jgi:hypothetical protein